MSVSALNWKYIGTTTLGGSTDIDDTLDAIYTLLNSSTYYDGSSRTPGSGVAWNPTKYVDTVTKAVYCSPSSDASDTCKGTRIIFAGVDSSLPSGFPLYNLNGGPANEESNSGSDSTRYHDWLQACLFAGFAKNAGSFTDIVPGTSTTPFTSGGFTGFTKVADENHFNNGKLFIYECLDAIWFTIMDGSDANSVCNQFAAGGLLDPGSASSVDSEADEVVYAMISSANTNPDVDFCSASTGFPNWRDTNNAVVSLSFSVGATTYSVQPLCYTNYSANIVVGSGGSETISLRSGRRVLIPVYANEFYDTGSSQRHLVGRLREIFKSGHNQTGYKLTGGGSDLGYFVNSRVTSNTRQGFLLKA